MGRSTAAYCLVDMDGIREACVDVRVGLRGRARMDGLRAEPKPRTAGHLSLRGMLVVVICISVLLWYGR